MNDFRKSFNSHEYIYLFSRVLPPDNWALSTRSCALASLSTTMRVGNETWQLKHFDAIWRINDSHLSHYTHSDLPDIAYSFRKCWIVQILNSAQSGTIATDRRPFVAGDCVTCLKHDTDANKLPENPICLYIFSNCCGETFAHLTKFWWTQNQAGQHLSRWRNAKKIAPKKHLEQLTH